MADGTENDLIVPSRRSAIRDTDRLISLVPKSGPLTTLQKKGMKASLATQNWKILFPVLG